MAKLLPLFLLLLLGSALPAQEAFRIVGYLPYYRFSLSDQINFEQLTHLNIAFANPTADGQLDVGGQDITPVVATGRAHGLTVLLSMGGGLTAEWRQAWQFWMQPGNRTAYIHNIMDYVRAHDLDGVDMDLEGQDVNALYSPFVLQLRDSLLSLNGPGSSDPCSGFYTSLGGNVLGGPACTAGNGVDLRLSQAVVASVDGDHATLLPIEQVASDMRSCPQRDQLGVARGASCLPGARDAGVAFPRGLWWDPQRPGHGQHITIVQNILFMLWYTYDAKGLPVTWTAQGPLVDGRVTAALLQWRREAVTELPRAQQIGGIELRVVDGTTIHLGWGLNDGSGSGFEVLEPFRFAPQAGQSLRTGLYADNQDLGWGMTLQEEGNIAFALLYYFAADDRLRWASAQGGGGIDQRLFAQAQTGICLFCSDAAVNAQPSGEWRLQSLGPDQLRFTGQLSTAVTPGGSWIRQTVLERFDPLD